MTLRIFAIFRESQQRVTLFRMRGANARTEPASEEVYCDVVEAQFARLGSAPPEQRLMMALVRDAVQCIEKHRFAQTLHGRRLFARDAEWILSDDKNWLYAFAKICDTLELDADAVRRALGLRRNGEEDDDRYPGNRVDTKRTGESAGREASGGGASC